MSIVKKKKLCSGCNTPQFLWKSNPPTCKGCAGRESQAKANGQKPITRKPIKSKPRPTVNGKPLHTALYMAAFGYWNADFMASELSGLPSNDLHHIVCRGAGSSKGKDRVENLMALTREEHIEYGDKKQYMTFLFRKHRDFMLASGVKFDKNWIEEQINRYTDEEVVN
jgi:hypothetical protein